MCGGFDSHSVHRFYDFVRLEPCLCRAEDKCSAGIQVAHVVSRGAGGGDFGNVVPLCVLHHREQHDIGILSFQRKHFIDMAAAAVALVDRWARSPQAAEMAF